MRFIQRDLHCAGVERRMFVEIVDFDTAGHEFFFCRCADFVSAYATDRIAFDPDLIDVSGKICSRAAKVLCIGEAVSEDFT